MLRRLGFLLLALAVGAGSALLSLQFLKGLNPNVSTATAASAASPVGARVNAVTSNSAVIVQTKWHPGDFQSGVMVLLWGNDSMTLVHSQSLLDRLARLHVNSVGLVFPIVQNGHAGTNLHADPVETPTDENLTIFIREAHRRGFVVMLRPLLDENPLGGPQFWRGNIDPPVTAWFVNYGALIEKYGRLAQTEHVEFLDIGTEFTSLESQTSQWLTLIAGVRRVFHGQLTYSMNSGTTLPAFGSALDFIGMDAYYPLKVSEAAPVSDLVGAWHGWVAALDQLQAQTGKPVVITELGLSPQSDVLIHPWLSLQNDPRVPLNLDLQRRYYAASCQALTGSVHGIYWWEFGLVPPAHPLTEFTFDPSGKPAEQEIGNCFGGQPSAAGNK